MRSLRAFAIDTKTAESGAGRSSVLNSGKGSTGAQVGKEAERSGPERAEEVRKRFSYKSSAPKSQRGEEGPFRQEPEIPFPQERATRRQKMTKATRDNTRRNMVEALNEE